MTVDLATLHEKHLNGHGPGGHCGGAERCASVGYLAIIEQLVGERDKFADQAHRMMTPCQCDPLQAGEELCNGGCLLTYERDRARDLVVAIESHVAELNDQVERLRAEMVEQTSANLTLQLERDSITALNERNCQEYARLRQGMYGLLELAMLDSRRREAIPAAPGAGEFANA